MNRWDDTAALHRHTWELIPWVVNGRASEEQRREVEAHLQSCADCRSEFAFQQQVQAAMRQERNEEADPQPALRRLWARIDAATAAPAPRRASLGWLTRGLVAALVLETLALSILGTALWMRPQPAPVYRTLSAAPTTAPAATIRMVLAPTLTQDELQALLRAAQLRIVDGPSEAGVYALAPSAPESRATARSLAQLRAHPGVRFAEPVTPADGAAR